MTWSALTSVARNVGAVSQAMASVVAVRGLSSTTWLSRAMWRHRDFTAPAAWPNYKEHLTHRKHFHPPHTWGVQKQTRLRCVDNSKIGREAMAEGKPPKVIQVYADRHQKRPHDRYGALGDRVLCAIKGEKIQGIIVGLRVNQRAGIPKFDTNNVVLIDPQGSPLGTRIHAPIPNCIRPLLKRKSHPKKADYTKIMAIATRLI